MMMKRSCPLVAENLFFFPEEILYEILSWLEVKSLLRCKSVCKIWYAVIKNKQFVDMHAVRNSQKFCNIERKSRLRNSDGTEEEIWYLSNSCEGFLLVKNLFFASAARPSTKPSPTYQIYNPSTRRVLDLPRPRGTVKSMFVFLNSSTSSYNVVSVCWYFKENNYDKFKEKLQFIDLGGQSNDSCLNADLSWRNLHISQYDNLNRYHVYFQYCMSSEGVLYILALQRNQSSNPKIICADLVKQTCTTLNAPQSLHFRWHRVHFQLWRGQPSIIFILEETLNVWMLEDYKKQKWADTIAISMPFLKQNPCLNKLIPGIYQVDEEDCLFYRKDNTSDSIYKLVTKEFCTIPSLPMKVPATLVSVKGMQSKTMKPGSKYVPFPLVRHVLVKKHWGY